MEEEKTEEKSGSVEVISGLGGLLFIAASVGFTALCLIGLFSR